MTKINNLFDSIEAGLQAETLKQKAIASNIANMETPGYRSVDVKFEDMLGKAIDQAERTGNVEISPELYQPYMTQVKENGNDVNFEMEIGKLVKNTLRHKAYVRILNKKYSQIELAVKV